MSDTLLQGYIAQQPALWRALLAQSVKITAPFAQKFSGFCPERVVFIGSGSSHYAALMAKPVMEQVWRCEVDCVIPSAFSLPRDSRPALYFAISQSGISTNTYEIIQALLAAGHSVVAVTEHPESPVGRAATMTIPLLIGEENIGAKTKGVTATALTLLLLALSVCKDEAYLLTMTDALTRFCECAADNLDAAQRWSAEKREQVLPFQHLYVLACGDALGAAQEAALKLLETNYLPVSWYPLDEYVHGIQNALDSRSCLLCLIPHDGAERARMLRLIDFARSVGALCLTIDYTATADADALQLCDVPDDTLRSLQALMALQVLAADLSAARGIDTSQRRYPRFFSMMGSKMEEATCPKKH